MERNLEEQTTKWLEAWTWAGRLISMVSEGVSATLSHLNCYRENELKCWLKTNNTVLSSWEKVAMEPFPHSAPDSNRTCQAFLHPRAFLCAVCPGPLPWHRSGFCVNVASLAAPHADLSEPTAPRPCLAQLQLLFSLFDCSVASHPSPLTRM